MKSSTFELSLRELAWITFQSLSNRLEEELEYQLQRTVTKNSCTMFISQLKGEKSRPVFNCFKFVFKEIVLRHQRGS